MSKGVTGAMGVLSVEAAAETPGHRPPLHGGHSGTRSETDLKTRPMPTTATLQSFMTKNNFQALVLGEDSEKRHPKDLALSGSGKRPWKDLALSGTTSTSGLKNGLERKVVEDLRRPSASGHDTTRHDTTRPRHDGQQQ